MEVGPRARLGIIEKKKYLVLARIQTPDNTAQRLVTIPAQYSKLSESLLTANCMKQGVPQLFKNLPAFYVTYPCFVHLNNNSLE
jgi:hypothetical protein